MTGVLALDVSASSTGWALWMQEDIRELFTKPGWLEVLDKLKISRTSNNWRVFDDGTSLAHGAWRLKSEWSREGEPHAKLHQNLMALREFSVFDYIYYERALTPDQRGGASNPHNDILLELIGHVKSFTFACELRGATGVHRASWQKEFIGPQKRGTKRKTIIDLFQERARQLGFKFRKDDEAAAIGILTYALLFHEHKQPPWIADETLRPMLEASHAG